MSAGLDLHVSNRLCDRKHGHLNHTALFLSLVIGQVLFDGSQVGNLKLELFVVFSPEKQLGAFLPPQVSLACVTVSCRLLSLVLHFSRKHALNVLYVLRALAFCLYGIFSSLFLPSTRRLVSQGQLGRLGSVGWDLPAMARNCIDPRSAAALQASFRWHVVAVDCLRRQLGDNVLEACDFEK